MSESTLNVTEVLIKLGEVSGKLDSVNQTQTLQMAQQAAFQEKQDERHTRMEDRVGKIENNQAKSKGIFAGLAMASTIISTVIGFVIAWFAKAPNA